MSVIFKIPHTARFLSTNTTFQATFNNPSPGLYDFNIDANTNKFVLSLERGTVYLIERMSFGGNLGEDVYRSAFLGSEPIITLRRKQGLQNVYKNPFQLPNFKRNEDLTAWFVSEKEGDELLLSFSGVLQQTADLVGVLTLDMFVSFAIYGIESTEFYKAFSGVLSTEVGQEARGR